MAAAWEVCVHKIEETTKVGRGGEGVLQCFLSQESPEKEQLEGLRMVLVAQ